MLLGNIRRKLSVRLSILLTCVVVPALVLVAFLVTLHEVTVTENLVLQGAKTTALTSAAAYGQILDEGVDSGALSLKDVLDPTYEEMKFFGTTGNPLTVDDKRYHTIVADYLDKHGMQRFQDAVMNAGGYLFASGMDMRGHVPSPHAKHDHPPKGNSTPENAAWDRQFSRGKRMYDGPEQIAAAGFLGNDKARTLVQEYLRDTGEPAWDVAAPIFVKGKHFGGFRIGVPKDRITQQLHDLVIGLSLLFGLLVFVTVGTMFVALRRYIKPLSALSSHVEKISMDPANLGVRIISDDQGEVGDITRAVNRLRASLYMAFQRMEATEVDVTEYSPRSPNEPGVVLSKITAVLVVLFALTSSAYADIYYRNFSASAAIGPPADRFASNLQTVSKTVLGSSGEIRFTRIPGIPSIPPRFAGDIIEAVSTGEHDGGYDAAYISGSELNRTWGFIYNSGIPFGPTFDEFMGFLYGPGIALVKNALERRGVVAFPIVGSPEQLSGYFQEPIGDIRGRKGIGLAGLCQQSWVLRYLPPGETVINIACDDLLVAHKIPHKNIGFLQAIPGGGSLIDAVMTGTLQGFEFASPVDDVSQVFNTINNPGTLGLRYVHTPGWHQQFLLTWMVVNKRSWNLLSTSQQVLTQLVARDHVLASYGDNMRGQGRALKMILGVTNMVLVQWPAKDLVRLQDATVRFLNARGKDLSIPTDDRTEYNRILEALRSYIHDNIQYWEVRGIDPRSRFIDW